MVSKVRDVETTGKFGDWLEGTWAGKEEAVSEVSF